MGNSYSFFEKLSIFPDILPQVKIKIIMVLAFIIILGVVLTLFFCYKKWRKLGFMIALITLFTSYFIPLSYFPNNENELIYPKYEDGQKIDKLTDDLAILTSKSGNKYWIKEGRLSPYNNE